METSWYLKRISDVLEVFRSGKNGLAQEEAKAKIAKDVSAGMVLLISIFALIVGLFIFIPHIILLFG